MVLKIKTFAHQKPYTFFKALGHPGVKETFEKFKQKPIAAIYDPEGHLDDFLSMANVARPSLVYIQATEALGAQTALITQLPKDNPENLLLLSFEVEKHLAQMGHLVPPTCQVTSLKN